MNRLLNKITFFTRAFTTVFAAALLTFSTASFAGDTAKIAEPTVRSLAKANPATVRNTDKMMQKRNSGEYKTSVTIQSPKQKIASSSKTARLRKTSPESSTNAFGFEIYDAVVYLLEDMDNDGFYSEFDVEIDVDVDSGFADVYAEIYFRNGNGDWQYLTTTEVFEIESNLASDSYTVAIQLLDGFPTDYYDILIDVYEDGFAGIVATLEPFDDGDLEFLPLEDILNDSGSNSLILDYISMDLFGDYDFDGFYHQFDIEIAISNETFARNLQAVLYYRDSVSGWYFATETTPTWVSYGDNLTISINADWGGTDFPTDYYDFLIEIEDVDTGEVVDSFGPEYLALSEKPLESSSFDEDTVVDEVHYSSGSSNSVFILLLLLIGVTRSFYGKKAKIKAE